VHLRNVFINFELVICESLKGKLPLLRIYKNYISQLIIKTDQVFVFYNITG